MPVTCHLLDSHGFLLSAAFRQVSVHTTVCTGAKTEARRKGWKETNNLVLINGGKTPERNGQLKGWDF